MSSSRFHLVLGVHPSGVTPRARYSRTDVSAEGIGGNTAIFNLLDSVLLEPLPYPQPDQLVQIFERNPEFSEARGIPYADLPVSAQNYQMDRPGFAGGQVT